MEFLKKLDKVVAGILKVLAVACCLGIAVILVVRVVIRFTPLNVNLSWTDEIVAWLMAWMIFLGAVLLVRDKGHFMVDLLPEKLKGTVPGCLLDMGITLLSVAFFAVFLRYSLKLTMDAVTFSLSPILKMSDRIPYSSMPTCCVLSLCYLVRDFVGEILALKNTVSRGKEKAAAVRS